MARKKLSLGEKIVLAASGNQEDEFPEDIEYSETSAKVIDLDEDHDKLRPVARSSLRAKNVQLLDEFDSRYSGEKVSRKKLADGDGGSGKVLVKRKGSVGFSSGASDEDDDDELEESDGDDDDEFSDTKDQELLSSDEAEGLGVKVKRGDVEDEDLNEEESDGGSESQEGEEEEDDSEVGSDEGEEEDSEVEESGAQSGMQTLSLRDKQAEIEKGRATLNQLRIWDSLLEVRIRLQKMLLDCNRLPQTTMYEELVGDIASDQGSSLPKAIEKSEEATKTLMHELLRLQEIMTAKNTETNKAISKKASPSSSLEKPDDPMNEEITSEEDDNSDAEPDKIPSPNRKRKLDANAMMTKAKQMKIEDFVSASDASFTSFKPYRNQTIQKWNDKTQFAGGKFNRKSASQQISTLRQIEQILSNKERLVKRTQVKRSNYSVIGEPSTAASTEEKAEETDPQEPNNPEVFDDDDFYHQLLRELIERKTSNVNDPLQLSHHWLELQKLRTKLKRKVDTKASKGRKIRYDVHAKLVNFMAPQDNCSMSSAAMKELFGSLFGQTKQ